MEKEEIKRFFEKSLKLKVQSIEELGRGVNNINYLIKTKNQKFNFRLNIDLKKPEKSREEFNSLNLIKKLNISPKPVFLGKNFIILEYVEGRQFSGNLTPKFLKNLAKVVAKIHSIKLSNKIKNKLRREQLNLKNKDLRFMLSYIKKNLKNRELLNIISNAKKCLIEIQKKLEKFRKIKKVITHGDICEQNILITSKDKLLLIDFEDLALRDPAFELSKIFMDFKEIFTVRQMEIFYDEYLKNKKDKTLWERVNLYNSFIIFDVFVWSIYHVLSLNRKEMYKSFLEKNKIEKDLKYVDTMFKRAIKMGLIDKNKSNFPIKEALR